jgi:LmbE family N-acetylglucosaminyl deacetylase
MSSTKIKTLILAPHVDDEVIGCWSVLNDDNRDITVLYCFELTPTRVAEAKHAASQFGFLPLFHLDTILPCHVGDPGYEYTEIYVPSRRDWHADHQSVNRQWRSKATHFYSVDMAHGVLLPDSEKKRYALDALYPSQWTLWNHDDKYWLFEDIQGYDYDKYRCIKVGQAKVTVLEKYLSWVQHVWVPSLKYKTITEQDFNFLLANCSGKVVVESTYARWEA